MSILPRFAGGLIVVVCLLGQSAAASEGLTIRDGRIMKDGRPYRGIGVNYFDAFYRTLKKADDRSYDEGFRILASKGIGFARLMGCGFWPVDMKLYADNKEEYFRRLDAVVESARKHGVGLIPSLFWNMASVPDRVGEPCDQWGNPSSRTHQFMRTYTAEVVRRYKDSPAIWGWEFGNEYNLAADLPNAAAHRPPVWTKLGTATTRSTRDELTHAMVRTAVAEFAKEVRRHDPDRIISAGHAFPRASAWHQMHEKSWTKDSDEQWAGMLAADNPDPVGVLSVHAYKDFERIALAMHVAQKCGKPLFVGEFGVSGGPTEASKAEFAAMLQAIERAGVPLAALWVYDFNGQKGEWSVTAENERSYQLEAIAEANRRIQSKSKSP